MFKKLLFIGTFVLSALPGFFLVKAMYAGVEQPPTTPVNEPMVTEETIQPPTSVKETASIPSPLQPEKTALHKPAQINGVQKITQTTKTILNASLHQTSSSTNTNSTTPHDTDKKTNDQAMGQTAQVVHVAQKLEPKTAPFIFLDELLSGWTIETSSAVVNTKSTKTSDGAYGIHAIFADAGGEIRFNNKSGIKVQEYDGINVYIAGKNGGEKLTILLYDAQGNKLGSQEISRYMYAKKITREYAQMYINFNPLKASDAVISQIVFQSPAIEEVYIDNLMFTAEPSVRPTSGFGDTSAPEVFTDEFQNGWSIPVMGADTRIHHKDGLNDSPSIQTTFREAGEQVVFRQEQGMHTYSYHYFTFWAKGQALQDVVYIQMKDAINTPEKQVILSDYINNTQNYNEFQKISIPLSDLHAENIIMNEIIFTSRDASHGLYLDTIFFEF